MAIYHCSVKIIGRSSGRSSVAAAAYRAGQKITNERDGITHDYTRKRGVAHSEIVLPASAPSEYNDRATLWNTVEKIERRCDSQTAREVEVALPLEFNTEENIQAVRNYIHENFTSKGMCADFAIHNNRGNPHAHIMLTMRDVSPTGFGKKNRDWNNVQLLEEWRENWANVCNRTLEQKGVQKIDHRSLEAQGLERMPTIHVRRSFEREVANKRIIQYNERFKPVAVAEYMNELNEGYTIIKDHINQFDHSEREARKIQDNIKIISQRAKDLEVQYHQLQQAKAERENMGKFQSKRELDAKIENMEMAYKYSCDYFQRSYKVSPSGVHHEVRRMKHDYHRIIKGRDNTNLTAYHEQMLELESEYKRQRLLAEIRTDRKEIFARLDNADMKLGRITPEDYRGLTPKMRDSQIIVLENERYNHAMERGFYDFVR